MRMRCFGVVWEVSQEKDEEVDIDLDESMSREFIRSKENFQEEFEKGKGVLQEEFEKGKETLHEEIEKGKQTFKTYQGRFYEELNAHLDWNHLKDKMHLGDFSEIQSYFINKIKRIRER